MKLSVSNIAWESDENQEAYDILKSYNVQGIELAPTKVFQNPIKPMDEKVLEYEKSLKDFGFSTPAMQALLFGRPELKIFDDSRAETMVYLKKIIDLAQRLRIDVLVFGSPKNRFIGDMHIDKAYAIARDFFQELGEYAHAKDTCFCIEPNAKEYGCDFITNTDEAIKLVELVNSKGFGLHVDAAVMAMNKEDVQKSLTKALPYMRHFHISEPFLNLIAEDNTGHERFAKILKDMHYKRWISIEMKNGVLASNMDALKRSLDFVQKVYM